MAMSVFTGKDNNPFEGMFDFGFDGDEETCLDEDDAPDENPVPKKSKTKKARRKLDIQSLKDRVRNDAHNLPFEIELTHCDEMDRVSESEKEFDKVNICDSPLV